MNVKNLSLFLLTAILLAGLVSAASFSIAPTSFTFSQSTPSALFSITPTSTLNISITTPQILDESGARISITSTPPSFPSINSTQSFNISTSADYAKLLLGKTYSGNLIVSNSNNSSDSQTIALNFKRSFCDYGEKGANLTIDKFDISNQDGDDTDWMPLDNIEVKVRVINNNADESDRIDTVVELGLYDVKGKEKLNLDKVDLGRIKGNGKYAETTFSFQVPSELGVDDSSYFLFVKAYQSGKKDQICTSKSDSGFFESISISRKDETSKLIKFDEITLDPSPPIQCGEQVNLKTKVANVGDKDQDKIKVKIYSKELGINDYKVIDGLNQDDSPQDIDFSFTIPSNATEKLYTLELRALYGFNDDYSSTEDAAYDDNSDSALFSIKVEGNCQKPVTENVQVTTSVDSTPKAGEEMIVRANVKNIGDSTTTFLIVPAGIESFATLSKVDPQTVTLSAGQSQDVSIYLNINSQASGEQTFNINAVYGGKTKSFSISPFTIQPKSSIFNLSFFSNMKGNWFIWIIVLINIVLIVLIIVVAVRIARK